VLVGIGFAVLAAAATAVTVLLPQRVAQHSQAPSFGPASSRALDETPKAPEPSPTASTLTAGGRPESTVVPKPPTASPRGRSGSQAPRPGQEQASAPELAKPPVNPTSESGAAANTSGAGVIAASPQPPPDVPAAPKPAVDTSEYERAVAAGLEALARSDDVAARRALESAERLRPDAPEVRHLGKAIQEGSQRRELERIRRAAADHEAGERWQPALQEYEAALRIDKHATFAVRGKARVENIVAIRKLVDFYIANPDRLQSPGPLAHARHVLATAAATPDGEASVRADRDRLQSLIDQATSPRAVRLRSDETTDVVVHRVGRLGRFRERSLTLVPGEYTAVGSREGYRDARIRFRVSADEKETIVEIRCEERI
jgi:hypothetical protein